MNITGITLRNISDEVIDIMNTIIDNLNCEPFGLYNLVESCLSLVWFNQAGAYLEFTVSDGSVCSTIMTNPLSPTNRTYRQFVKIDDFAKMNEIINNFMRRRYE